MLYLPIANENRIVAYEIDKIKEIDSPCIGESVVGLEFI